jgi:hypothetical protein
MPRHHDSMAGRTTSPSPARAGLCRAAASAPPTTLWSDTYARSKPAAACHARRTAGVNHAGTSWLALVCVWKSTRTSSGSSVTSDAMGRGANTAPASSTTKASSDSAHAPDARAQVRSALACGQRRTTFHTAAAASSVTAAATCCAVDSRQSRSATRVNGENTA